MTQNQGTILRDFREKVCLRQQIRFNSSIHGGLWKLGTRNSEGPLAPPGFTGQSEVIVGNMSLQCSWGKEQQNTTQSLQSSPYPSLYKRGDRVLRVTQITWWHSQTWNQASQYIHSFNIYWVTIRSCMVPLAGIKWWTKTFMKVKNKWNLVYLMPNP